MISSLSAAETAYARDYFPDRAMNALRESTAVLEKTVFSQRNDILQLSNASDEPDIKDPILKNIIERVKRAKLKLSTKIKLLDYIWNMMKAGGQQGEQAAADPGKMAKAIYNLIAMMESQERYELSVGELNKHIKEINRRISALLEKDEKDKKDAEKLAQASEQAKSRGNSETQIEDDLKSFQSEKEAVTASFSSQEMEGTEEDLTA
jgi:hypothetical protein